MDAKQLANEAIIKAKSSKLFEVRYEVGEGWLPNGSVPFDLRVKNGICQAKVLASSQEEAEQMVYNYFNESEE